MKKHHTRDTLVRPLQVIGIGNTIAKYYNNIMYLYNKRYLYYDRYNVIDMSRGRKTIFIVVYLIILLNIYLYYDLCIMKNGIDYVKRRKTAKTHARQVHDVQHGK